MDAIAFFDSDEAELPRSRNTDDFADFLQGMFDSYIARLAQMQSPDYVTQEILANQHSIAHFCDHIKEAVAHALSGLPHRAFEALDTGLQGVIAHINRLCTPTNVAGTSPLEQLYRIRVSGPEGASFDRPDLYHIPYEKRHLITRQRYSLPGLPSLYLGGTLWVCWEEVGRPNYDTIYYSRFRPQAAASITYLDFGYRPALIGAMIDANRPRCQIQSDLADFAVSQAVCWPLLAACSVERMHGNSPFIHEYLVPHLLLQWIVHTAQHDGIRYFSAKVKPYIKNPAVPCNYVFPARNLAVQGHCSVLRAKFEMSQPLSWQLIERMGMPPGMAASDPVHGNSDIEFVPGIPIKYRDTPFGGIEAKSIAYPLATF